MHISKYKATFIITSFILFGRLCFGQSQATKNAPTDSSSMKNPIYFGGIRLDKYFSLLGGYNVWNYNFIELGLAINKHGVLVIHPYADAYFVSTEIKLSNKLLIGPKIGCWASGGIGPCSMGLNLIYYTDFKGSSLRFRPEIGVGMWNFKLVYGYNVAITNKDFNGINKNNLSLAIAFGLKKIKTIRRRGAIK